MNCYIYGIRDQAKAEYFYVGSTGSSVQTRLKSHLSQVCKGRHRNKHFANKVRLLKAENVTIDTLETVTPEERFTVEYRWINKLRSEGHPLTNVRLIPWPHEQQPQEMTPNRISLAIFEALLAPEICEVPENQELYSKLRDIAQKCVKLLLTQHKRELLSFLGSGVMP